MEVIDIGMVLPMVKPLQPAQHTQQSQTTKRWKEHMLVSARFLP